LARVRGSFHQALHRILVNKYAEKAFTQESLARATGLNQSTIGQYLRPNGTAGTLDLDEADAALAHIGSSLTAFIADPDLPVVQPAPKISAVAKALARTLDGMEDDDLRIVLGIARSVRAASRRTKRQSVSKPVPDRLQTARKIGGKR
jgi:hypothetical protein